MPTLTRTKRTAICGMVSGADGFFFLRAAVLCGQIPNAQQIHQDNDDRRQADVEHLHAHNTQPVENHHDITNQDKNRHHAMAGGQLALSKCPRENQQEKRQHRHVEQITAQDIAQTKPRLVNEHGGGNAGEQFRQTGDSGQHDAADKGTGQTGFLVQQIHIFGCLDRKQHDARSDEQVQQINHRFLPPKQHTLREEDKKRLIDDGIARNRIPCCTFVYESHFLRKYQSTGHRRDC